MSTTVQDGLYYGFTAAEIKDELSAYKRAVKEHSGMRADAGGGRFQFVGMNGRQITFDYSEAQSYLEEWRQEIQNAEAQLAGTTQPFTTTRVARFA